MYKSIKSLLFRALKSLFVSVRRFSERPAVPVKIATSLEEARQLFVQSPSESIERCMYLKQWREFSRQAIRAASNVWEIRQAFFQTHGETFEKRWAMRKWNRLVKLQARHCSRDELVFLSEICPPFSTSQALVQKKLSHS